MTEPGECGDDLAAGADVVGTHPGEARRLVAPADVDDGEVVGDQSAQFVGGGVAAQEEAAVRQPYPVERAGSPAPAPPMLDPVNSTRS
ncbi:hypothetical protein SVIOM342S_01813 [Streptomyces violaceorubidus]